MDKEIKQINLNAKPVNYFSQARLEMLEFIPQNAKTFLDVGCGEGLFGNELKTQFAAKVVGVELDTNAAKKAMNVLDKVYCNDINKLIPELQDNYFDCIVFNDILEHLVDPYNLLLNIKSKLSQNGVIVCSLPNVRYLITLKDLIFKKQWKYEDYGILDKTHLRFFTNKSILDMFEELNFDLITIKGINPIKSYKFQIINILTLGFFADSKYLQFACVAKPKAIIQ